jgi:uncharacterized protein YcsI (UPF0317 family)
MDSPGDAVGAEKTEITLDGLGEISDRRVVSSDQCAELSADSDAQVTQRRTECFGDGCQSGGQSRLGGHVLRIGVDAAKPPVGGVVCRVIDGGPPVWWGGGTT